MAAEQTYSATMAVSAARRRRWPPEMSILLVLLGVALLFEVLGWFVQGQSFLANVEPPADHDPASGGDRHHRGRRHPGHHHRRHRPVSSGSVVAMTAMIAATFAQSSTWPKVFYPSLVDLPWIVPLLVGLAVGAVAGLDQWRPDCLHENSAIHRHARHDGLGARRFALVHERQSGVRLHGQFLIDRRRAGALGAGLHFPRRGRRIPYRHALHALRQVHLRHRRQRPGRTRLRHRYRTPSDQSLRHRRHAGRARRHRFDRARQDRAGRHGHELRARRHRRLGHRRRLAVGRPGPRSPAPSSAR